MTATAVTVLASVGQPAAAAPSRQRWRMASVLFVVVTVLAGAYVGSILLDPVLTRPGWRMWQAIYGVMEVAAGALVLIVATARGTGDRTRKAWTSAAAGVVLLGISAFANAAARTEAWLTHLEELTWLLSYPCFVRALISVPGRPLTLHERRRSLIDGAILTVSVCLLLWYVGVQGIRIAPVPKFSPLDWFLSTLLILDVLVLQTVSIAAIRVAEPMRPSAWTVLLGALVVGSLGDVIYVVQIAAAEGDVKVSSVPDFFWGVSAWLVALASWLSLRGAAAVDPIPAMAPRTSAAVFAMLPFVFTVLVGAVGLYEGAQLQNAVFRVVAIGVVVLALLLAVRLWLAQRENAALLAEQLQQAEQRREAQKLEAVGRLAGGMAHEFNNLLTVMQQAADALLTRNRDDEDARDVAGAARRAAGLTRQLLTFSRRGTASGVVDAAAALTDVRPLLQRLVRDEITLDIAAAPQAGLVALDGASFEQVLFNLVRNAADAITGPGWITIRVEPSPMTGFARLTVADTGAGMSRAVRERLFEPFFTTKPAGQGTGLGLAIVHGLVTGAGGTLDVETTEGRGARFFIDLPRARQPAAAPAPPATPEPAEVPLVVLVVDDDASVRRSLRRTLERIGHQVREAEDGAAALELLEGVPDVALVLTDTAMPRVDGWELIREVRQRRPGLPIIRMSGFADPPGGTGEETADAFLAKPFDIGVLRETVVRLSCSAAARP